MTLPRSPFAALALPLALGLTAVPAPLAQTARTPTSFAGGRARDLIGMDVEESRVALVWCNPRLVNAVVSDDCGATFGPVTRVDPGPLADKSGATLDGRGVHLHGDRIYATWLDSRGGSIVSPELYFGRSVDGGASWSEIEIESDVSGGAVFRRVRDTLDPTNDTLHLLFATRLAPFSSSADLHLHTSTDGGDSFGSPIFVAPSGGSGAADLWGHDMQVTGSTISVAWAENDAGTHSVRFRASTDGGATFAPVKTLDTGGFLTFGSPRIAREGDTIVVTWLRTDGANGALLYASFSIDGGFSFGAPTIVGEYAAPNSDIREAVPLVANGAISVLWSENRSGVLGPFELYHSKSTDGGQTFSETRIGAGIAASTIRVAQRGSRVAATWSEYIQFDDTYSMISDDGGLTWSSPIRVSSLAAATARSTIAFGEGDDVQVAWRATGTSFSVGEVYSGGYRTTAAASELRTAGANVPTYAAAPPVLGQAWTATVDVGSTGHAFGVIRLQSAPAMIPRPNGEFLLTSGVRVFESALLPGPIAQFQTTLPNELCLSGRALFSQAAHVGGGPAPALTNARDLTVGTF